MANFLENLRKIKFVRRRSSLLTKAVLLSVVAFSTAALLALNAALVSIQEQTEDLRTQAVALEQEQQDLENRIDQLGTEDSTKQIAQEELGLVEPGTIIINPQQ
jgi:cell division protein FtsB